MIDDLDIRAMELAAIVAADSGDTGRKVGCVITGADRRIIASACNDIPDGCADLPERRSRPLKYQWTEHAERNAIYSAARHGEFLEGSTAYTTLYPCTDCARALVQSGISRMVSPEPDFNDPIWGDGFRVSKEILAEAGVVVDHVRAV